MAPTAVTASNVTSTLSPFGSFPPAASSAPARVSAGQGASRLSHTAGRGAGGFAVRAATGMERETRDRRTCESDYRPARVGEVFPERVELEVVSGGRQFASLNRNPNLNPNPRTCPGKTQEIRIKIKITIRIKIRIKIGVVSRI